MERSSLGWWGIAIEDIEGSHKHVMFGSMVFTGVVGLVEDALLPQVFELMLGIMALQPVKMLSMDFEALAVMVPMVRPCAVMLLVVIGVGLA